MNKQRDSRNAAHSSLPYFLIILLQLICLPLLLLGASGLIRRQLDHADQKMGVEAFRKCMFEETARMADVRGNPEKCNDWDFVRDVYITKARQ
mgnify:CR=1 FL=1